MILSKLQPTADDAGLAVHEYPQSEPAYRIFAGDDSLSVLEFTVHEEINEPGLARLELHSSQSMFDPVSLINEPAFLQFACGTESDRKFRYFHGFIQQVSLSRRADCGTYFTAWIVPRIAKLHWRFESRVLVTDPSQKQDVREVLERLLRDAGIGEGEYNLDGIKGEHPIYSFLVQYEETVLAFLHRLCESEGIGYFIDHESDKAVITFFDSVWSTTATSPYSAVSVRRGSGAMGDEYESLTSFDTTHSLDYDNIELRSYDFRNSRKPLMNQSLSQTSEKYRQLYRFPAPFQEVPQPATELGRQAEIRRDGLESLSDVTAEGGGNYRSMQVGKQFFACEVDGDPEAWLCTEQTRHGEAEMSEETGGPVQSGRTTFSMRFRAVPADRPYRPPMRTPRPIIRGTHTATVVGPKGDVSGENDQEIYTDEYGRVRIHLHFDREWKWARPTTTGTEPKDTSFWVRVRQDWAGRRYGSFFLPRIGQEVLVDFLDGDPNCPVIIGALYNDQQKVPYPLPLHKTRSTIKTNSTPGGKGFNEIRFEDKKGSEQVFIHAQSRHDLRVGGTSKTSVGSDHHLTVGGESKDGERHGDHFVRVFGDSHTKTHGDEYHLVEGTSEQKFVDHAIQEYLSNHSHLVESGEYFLNAKSIILQAEQSICFKVGCNYIMIDKTGINIFGLPKVLINTPGVPAVPDPEHLTKATEPTDAGAADSDNSGQVSLWQLPQDT